jgi:hypothetical protein
MRHGVYGDGTLFYLEMVRGAQRWRQQALEGQPEQVNAADLMDLAYLYGLRQVWVLPGSRLSTRVADTMAVEAFWASPERNFLVNTYQSFGSGRLPDREAVEIALPERDPRWPFQMVGDPVVLFATISYAEQVLGVSMSWSPGHVGQELMRETNQGRRAAYIRPSQSDLSIFQAHQQLDLHWSRQPSPVERGWPFVHGYDKNAMYIGAAAAASLGAGEYTYQTRPAFSPGLPGLWHIRISGSSHFDGQRLPHPTDGRDESWQYTPTVKLALDVGYEVEVLEGYFFTEYHRTLRYWAERIRDARAQLEQPEAFRNKEAADAALLLVKAIYTQSLGWLAHVPEKLEETNRPFYRPDWYFTLIALARGMMFRTIEGVWRQAGQAPVKVATDAVFYASNDPNPRTAVPILTIEKGVGRFKHTESFAMSEWLARERLESRSGSAVVGGDTFSGLPEVFGVLLDDLIKRETVFELAKAVYATTSEWAEKLAGTRDHKSKAYKAARRSVERWTTSGKERRVPGPKALDKMVVLLQQNDRAIEKVTQEQLTRVVVGIEAEIVASRDRRRRSLEVVLDARGVADVLKALKAGSEEAYTLLFSKYGFIPDQIFSVHMQLRK